MVGQPGGPPVQARRGFSGCIVHHVGRTGPEMSSASRAPAEVGRGTSIRVSGLTGADLPDAVGKVLGAAVAQIVAVDTGDHHVLKLEAAMVLASLRGSLVSSGSGAAVAHIAEGAAACRCRP